MQTNDITAVILAYNESQNIEHCLKSIDGFCPVMLVDSGSNDDTVDIASKYTDQIFVHDYENHANQWQWAITELPIESPWILALDADFVVSEELKNKILSDINGLKNDINGIYVRHRYVFGGGEIRFGGTKHNWLRIIRKGFAKADQSDLVDFRFLVDGQTVTWDEKVIEYNRHDDDMSTWMKKQDKFSVRLAVEEELRRQKLLDWERRPNFKGNPDQRTMWLRDRWLNLPLYIRPVIYFLYRYIFALGFLDGRAGFLYHVLQGFWLRLCVDWKIGQLRKLNLNSDELIQFSQVMLKTHSGSVEEIYRSQLSQQTNK